jgi:hypothetical protein
MLVFMANCIVTRHVVASDENIFDESDRDRSLRDKTEQDLVHLRAMHGSLMGAWKMIALGRPSDRLLSFSKEASRWTVMERVVGTFMLELR